MQSITNGIKYVFANYAPLDLKHTAMIGFSDGATYALSAGLPLGRIFNRIIAFSPGDFAAPSMVSWECCGWHFQLLTFAAADI